jgi:hypothetical protein
MTLVAGLTPSGFTAPTFAEILADVDADCTSTIDAGLNLAPDQPIGQWNGIQCEKLAEIYELIATLYGAFDPGAAEGRLLVNLAALTGTVPQAATYSTVTCSLNLNATTTVTAGALAYVNGQPQNLWELVTTVTSVGAGIYPAQFRSLNPGPFSAPAYTLTQIQVSTSGWNSITNPLDAVLGQSADTDATLRTRRQEELGGQGSGDIDSIRRNVLNVLGVRNAIVTENTSPLPAADGSPGKSFHVVAWTGPGSPSAATIAAIAQAIWISKDAGILAYGASSGVATDVLGNPQTVGFDFANQLPVYISLTTSSKVPLTSDQVAVVKQAIVDFAEGSATLPVGIDLGQNVVALSLRAAAFDSLPGIITDVPSLLLGFAPSPTYWGNLSVTSTQIATFDTSNILVNGL